MKNVIKMIGCAAASLLVASCVTTQTIDYLEAFTPEESGLNLVKLTDESSSTIMGGKTSKEPAYSNLAVYKNTKWAYTAKDQFRWYPLRALAISPDGTKLAYLNQANGQTNIMVRNAGPLGTATQRTFRAVNDVCWGDDQKLYFADINDSYAYISAVNAEQGSMMSQITNGSVVDSAPVTLDGKKVFFTRVGNTGPSIWSIDRRDGTLTSCAVGYNACLIPGDDEAFYCVRNSSSGRSEIWYVNYVKGQETLVLSDEKRSFANPSLSPDGKWIVCEGSSRSVINDKVNVDIFVVRTDGSNLTQLTYNPSQDQSPVWAKDGRSIYFLSGRANKDGKYNIWRMNFNVD